MGRKVAATGELSDLKGLSKIRVGNGDVIPARVSVRSPSTTNTIELVVDAEVFEFQVMFQPVGHGNASWTGTDNDCIELLSVRRHDGEMSAKDLQSLIVQY